MATTYTVVQGDTLGGIASKYGTTVAKLVELNDITDPNFIVVGQVLTITNDGGTSGGGTPAPTKKKNTSPRAIIKAFGLQSGTDRTLYATWTWDKSNTDKYQIKWTYATGDGVGFIGNNSTVTDKQCTYNAPQNATHVTFYVKPISKTRKVNNKDTSYWTAEWSTKKVYYFKDNPPSKPPVPTVELKGYKLTASLNNLNVNGTQIQFQVVKNDASVFKTVKADIKTNSASFSCNVTAGNKYKVRCRAIRGKLNSDWSDYSNNLDTAPATPDEIITLKALSETGVQLDWTNVSNADSYIVEYTTDKMYFNSSTSEVSSVTIDASAAGHAEITGLETGDEYFFRVKATNSSGDSGWTPIKSIAIGSKPVAPTTWSSTTTVVTGSPLNLYWVHNTEDASDQTYAELELITNDVKAVYTIKNTKDEDDIQVLNSYMKAHGNSEVRIDTSTYKEGTDILWRVRTAGVTKAYGDWSIQRTINVYAPPTLEFTMTDSDGNNIDTVTTFPFYINGLAGPNTQKPIGYHVTVSANESYETVDSTGSVKMVNKGDAIYSKHFDISDPLTVIFSPSNIDLENNVDYTVTCIVSMNSGLTAESSLEFTVSWVEEECWPNADIAIDEDTIAAYIRPYCLNSDEVNVEDILLSVYRREFDGTFTEIATDIDNGSYTFVTDPHPALDYARYRIVATTKTTGAVSYYDVPGYPVGEKAVIIQWNEEWSNFDNSSEDSLEKPVWSGSLLRLPYNIDVSDSNDLDVVLVKYIGRKHPISYYGTQLGTNSNWNTVIPKNDKETLYGLRRLSIWTGDVYVREPSGSGYWANIKVSFDQKHKDITIPVTLTVTRVEGGV